jgi:hypothetical protein
LPGMLTTSQSGFLNVGLIWTVYFIGVGNIR